MVRIEIAYEEGLHTSCQHGPSGSELATDAPVDNHGRGESFSPTDLLATALGSCAMTVMGIVAERHGWKLEGARVSVDKHMVSEPLRRVGRLALEIHMPSGVPTEARPVLESTAHTCPVKQSLHPDVEVEMRFDWPA